MHAVEHQFDILLNDMAGPRLKFMFRTSYYQDLIILKSICTAVLRMVSITEKRRVYVLCRPIFSGENARVRKRKKVKEMVNSSRISLHPLLEELGEAKLVEASGPCWRTASSSLSFAPRTSSQTSSGHRYPAMPSARRLKSLQLNPLRRHWMKSPVNTARNNMGKVLRIRNLKTL
jgi:hypothetical protein